MSNYHLVNFNGIVSTARIDVVQALRNAVYGKQTLNEKEWSLEEAKEIIEIGNYLKDEIEGIEKTRDRTDLNISAFSIVEYEGEPYVILMFNHHSDKAALAKWPLPTMGPDEVRGLVGVMTPDKFVECEKLLGCPVLFSL